MKRFQFAAVGTLVALFSGSGAAMAQTSSAPVVRIAELEIDPAQLDAYRAFLTEEIETSVKLEPGVLSLSAVALRGNPTRIRILEVYADQAAYEAHLTTPHFLKYKTRTADMVRGLNLLETDPVLMCAKGDDGLASRCLAP